MKSINKNFIVGCMVLALSAIPALSKPLSVSVDYTIVSDYIFRGINFGPSPAVSHQLGVGLELDTSELGMNIGNFGVSFWGEWYGDQVSALNVPPGSGGSLQEVDYTLYWNYEIPQFYTTFELGWIAYTFPQLSGDAYYTNEWYVKLDFNDSVLFGTEKPVLNPYVAYYLDVDDVDGGWLELGISHDFPLAQMGMENASVLKDITVTPSLVVGIDDGQMGKSMRLANMQYGIDIGYDVSSALGIPEEYGSVSLTGFIYFSDAIFNAAISDELWGGITFGYGW